MKKIKPLNKKEKILTRNNESNISSILNKKSLNQTHTTDYSLSQEISQNDIKLKKEKKSKKIPSKPLIAITTSEDGNKNLNKIKSQPNININKNILPTNVNAFYHLIYDNLFGSCESLNWALGLRLANKKNNLNSTKNITEPTFYIEDEKKFSEKNAKYIKPLLNQFNPDFSKIQHLTRGKNKGNINYSQFSFSSCLRNMKEKQSEINKEKERHFNLTPLPNVTGFKYKIRNLAPITTSGISNLNKIENYIPKNYQITYENTKVGNDIIKKKNLSINRNYTLCGFGECLGEQKYNNKFREVNIFANRNLLSTTSNPFSKFELGLRDYKYNNILDKDKYKNIQRKQSH